MDHINLPLPSGIRLWMDDLSARFALLSKRLSSDTSCDVLIVELRTALDTLSSELALTTAQDDAAHELEMAHRPTDAAQQRGFGQSEGGSDHLPGSERENPVGAGYRDLAKARKAASSAYKAGRKSRRRRRRK